MFREKSKEFGLDQDFVLFWAKESWDYWKDQHWMRGKVRVKDWRMTAMNAVRMFRHRWNHGQREKQKQWQRPMASMERNPAAEQASRKTSSYYNRIYTSKSLNSEVGTMLNQSLENPNGIDLGQIVFGHKKDSISDAERKRRELIEQQRKLLMP